jgi:hypothetical protein
MVAARTVLNAGRWWYSPTDRVLTKWADARLTGFMIFSDLAEAET